MASWASPTKVRWPFSDFCIWRIQRSNARGLRKNARRKTFSHCAGYTNPNAPNFYIPFSLSVFKHSLKDSELFCRDNNHTTWNLPLHFPCPWHRVYIIQRCNCCTHYFCAHARQVTRCVHLIGWRHWKKSGYVKMRVFSYWFTSVISL